MAGVAGGSQIDVRAVVSQLVSAERAPMDKQIARDTSRVTTQISALGQLMGSLSTFRSALSSLKTVDVFSTRTAASGDATKFTATANAKATPGSYDIEVVQLAKAQQLSSNPFSGGSSTTVGTGTLTLSLGTKNFSVAITDNNSSLAGIRDAINAATDNPGIRATLVQGTTGSRLVLSSAQTGAANAITVAQTGGNGGLSQIAYSAGSPGNYTEISAAQDAIVNIANAQATSATNTLEGAIDGVTLTLLKETEADEPVSLSVGYDSAAVTSRINNFVTAYNALASQIGKLQSYNATTETAGPMLGDALLGSIENELRRALTTPVTGEGAAYPTLANIGITTQANGTLAIDGAKLKKALDTNFDAVGKLFGSEGGVGARLFAQVDERLKGGGAIETRSKTLVDQQKSLEKRKLSVDARMAVLGQQYTRQFSRLDTLLSGLQVTSSYMSQQIEALANMGKK